MTLPTSQVHQKTPQKRVKNASEDFAFKVYTIFAIQQKSYIKKTDVFKFRNYKSYQNTYKSIQNVLT